jgi:hypothetical protein
MLKELKQINKNIVLKRVNAEMHLPFLICKGGYCILTTDLAKERLGIK